MTSLNPKWMFYAFVSIIGLLIVSVGYTIYPRTVLKIHNYEVYNDISPLADRTMKDYTIMAGDDMEFDISFTKFMDVPCEVTVLLKQIDNGYLYPYEVVPRYITRMPIGSHHYKHSTLVPRSTPEGKYVFIRKYRCEVNPLNTFDTSITSNEFTINGKMADQRKEIEKGNAISEQNQFILRKMEKEIKKR